jgi:ABA DEFICIENT 4-like
MDAASAFSLLNAAVLPWWALWLAAPRSRWGRRAASHAAVFAGLSAVYAGLLVAALASGGLAGFDYPALRAGLATPAGFLAGWTHTLAFDLFVGAWMVREANRLDVGVRPFLLFTLLAGPIGLGGFLARRAWRLRAWGRLGDTDLA